MVQTVALQCPRPQGRAAPSAAEATTAPVQGLQGLQGLQEAQAAMGGQGLGQGLGQGRHPPGYHTRRRAHLRSAARFMRHKMRLINLQLDQGLPPGGRTRMTEEIGKGPGVLSPGDLNSNNNGETTASYAASYVSNTSSQNDADFIQDNSEYQWFLDYGYREGLPHHVSVLSSLSESYARGLLSSGVDGKACGLYDDLARNLDANLAEVDMENFCAEDIHSLLNTLPTMCDLQKGPESNSQGEMFASISGLSNSMMGKFDFDSSISPHSSSQGEDSAGSIDTMSICKSELLFSPVKESAVPGTINFSVDSLDSDIMLTCQANKDNYTIAFEGSTTMGSEDSEEYHDQGDSEATSTDSNNWSRTSRMMNPALAALLGKEQQLHNSSLVSTGNGKHSKNGCGRPNCKQALTSSHNSMARSDSTFTTWSKLKKPETENPLEQQQLSRHPSGNNNTTQGTEEESQPDNADQTAVKSRSLPNLAKQQRQQHQQRIRQQLRASLALSSSSSIESSCVKLYDVRCNGSPLTSSGASSCSGGKAAGGINLVRLFMKQRNGSGTDHSSSVSDGWDSDSCVRSATGPMRRNNNEWQSNGGSQSCRGKQVFRSCQGVDTAQNDNSVDECQCLPEESLMKANNKQGCRSIDSLNCGHPRRNNGSWVRGEEMTDCSTCTFEDSLYRLEDGIHRTHEQITEEDADGPSEHSESVEQVSESISKLNSMARDSTLENVHSCDDSSNYSSHHGHVLGSDKTEGNLFHCRRYNLNNNNSLERDDISSESRRQTRGSVSNCCCCSCENKECRKHSSAQCQLPLISRSIQTSCMLDVLSKATLKEVKVGPNKERSGSADRVQEQKEKEDDKAEKVTKPVYVYYPNYALPDLGFLKDKKPNVDLTKVYLRPQKFSATANACNTDLISKIPACLRQPKKAWKQPRQFSSSDIENLRKKGFSHIQDWSSLTFLLPKEYRVLLADVPEVLKHVDVKSLREQELQPLFCASAPLKNRHSQAGCECTNLSSASSTNTQPSSGYRGSSTLLTDSSSQSPNFNPLFVYRYDSVSSEASLIGAEKKKPAISSHVPPLPKRSVSLPGGKDGKKVVEDPYAPARPPLPKGILRSGLDGDVVSNSKMRKEAANKRFSMYEMGAGQNASATNKRCSLQEPYYLPGQSGREEEEGMTAENSEHNHHHLCSHAEFEDVLRLSDYIHLSGLSDVSLESEWDDEKMARLRQQVSRFLSTGSETFEHSNQQTSKTVSFGKAGQLRPSSSTGELKTPPNSPNVSALLGTRQYQCKLQQPLSDLPIREEDPGESSADEHASAPITSPSCHSRPDFDSKKALVTAVSDAVEEVISHFSGASTPGECARLGDSGVTPAVANSVIGTLCPALYAVLSDGLLTNIATAFGDISNSVWQVVEASAQQGHMTRSLNELVLRLNSEDVFSEGLLKFNAFVFGLLNVRSMDAWMGYLRTRESILRKHYSSESLLVLSLRGGPMYHSLTDSLLAALRPLALLPFHLDLLFECRQLHQSLQRLGAAAATSPTSLLRLVRSIQNSVGQLTIAEEYASTFKGDSTSSDNPLPDLLELSANSAPLSTPLKRNSRARQLRRPRSCVDAAADLLDPSSSLRKRWSGVQLGSKLSQALDRLLAEDTEEDFSDSLNATPITPSTPRLRPQSDQSTSEDATLVSQCSDMDHTDTDISDRSAAAAKARRANALGVGGKFRRLQMKWEKLSGSGTESRDHSTRPSPEASPTKAVRPRTSFGGSSRTSPAMSPVKSTSRTSLHSPGSTTSSSCSLSRIPRPVTSPVRPPTGIPLPRCATSPTQTQIPPLRKPSLPLPQGKRTSTVGTRASRVDQSHPMEHRSPATRPSSLPYSPVTTGHPDLGRKSSQRRANSASVNRPAPSTRKAKSAPRYVRTIKHQLASDSGHLSFSTGERLSLVLEVDEEWLLCCRGDRKGLVRRSAVVATQDHSSRF